LEGKLAMVQNAKHDPIQPKANTTLPMIAAFAGALIVALAAMGLATNAASQRQPEVTLRLVDPSKPRLLIINRTGASAKRISYTGVLFKADKSQEGYKTRLPTLNGTLVFLSTNQGYGPIQLFNAPGATWLKPGDTIFGNLAVNCRNCAQAHVYWVLFTWGEGGWFAEVKDIAEGSLIVPQPKAGQTIRPYRPAADPLAKILEIDEKERIPIGPFTRPEGGEAALPFPLLPQSLLP
jgi:hypothetical protein